MAGLSAAEQRELDQLQQETGGLSIEEAKELDQLNSEISEAERDPTLGEQATAALQGFGESATFGALPAIQAAAEPLTDKLFGAVTGDQVDDDTDFQDRTKRAARQLQSDIERAPGAGLAGRIGGAFVPGLGAAGLAAKGTKGALGALRAGKAGQAILRGAGTVGGLGAIGAAEGALQTPVESIIEAEELGPLGLPLDAKGRIERAATGGLIGAAIPGVGKPVAKAIAKAPKKFLSVFGGVRTDLIDKYIANPQLIKEAEEIGRGGVEDIINDAVAPVKENLLNATIDMKTAKKFLADIDSNLVTKFSRERATAKESLRAAERALESQFKAQKEALKQIPPPTDLGDAVAGSLESLKQQVITGSNNATNSMLREVQGNIPLTGVRENIDEVIDRLRVGAQRNFAPGTEDVAESLLGFRQAMDELGEEITPQDAKRFMKLLDQQIDFSDVAGNFDEPLNIAKKQVRNHLDEIIKDMSPTYREQMQEVAADAELLNLARRAFGKPQTRLNKLRRIDADSNMVDKEVLLALGNRTNNPFNQRVADFESVKSQIQALKGDAGKRELLESLPEFKDVEEAKRALADVDFLDRAELIEKVARDEQRIALAQKAKEAEELFNASKEINDSIKGFLNSDPKNKINSLVSVLSKGSDQGTKIRNEFQKLSKLTDQDLIQMVDDLRVSEAFSKDFTRGSRNTNLWAAMSASGNFLMTGDPFAGAAGLGLGAAVGASIDKFGPQTTRRILDWVSTNKGLMTVKKINNSPFAEDVRSHLRGQFELAITKEMPKNMTIDILPEDIPTVRAEIETRDDLSNADKAKMINSLNERGQIDGADKLLGRPEPAVDRVEKARKAK